MALQKMDGFNEYATAQIPAQWANPGATFIGPSPAGDGNGLSNNNFPTVCNDNLSSNQNELVQGVRAYFPGTALPGNQCILGFWDNGTFQCGVGVSSAGALVVGTALNSSNQLTNIIASSQIGLVKTALEFFVELKAIFEPSSGGSVYVQLNGVLVASATGVTTSVSGNAYANQAGFLFGALEQWFARDYYCFDGSGAYDNGFAGDISVVALPVVGAGRISQFTANGAATTWQAVAGIPPAGDTAYAASDVVGYELAVALAAISSGVVTVKCVQLEAYMRKDAAGTRTAEIGFGNGTTESFGDAVAPGTTYSYYRLPLDVNPLTGEPWEIADLETAQIAVKVAS